jgi:hypothetical protein
MKTVKITAGYLRVWNWRVRIFKRFGDRYFDQGFDLRVQAFNLLAFAGMAAGVVAALSALFSHAGVFNVV